jgi:hypothetical protein
LIDVLVINCIFHSLQVLVCAPSNVAVDQLAEKISAKGLKVLGIVSFSSFVSSNLIRSNLSITSKGFVVKNSGYQIKDDVTYRTARTVCFVSIHNLIQVYQEFILC